MKKINRAQQVLAKQLFANKQSAHRARAHMPIEEKIYQLVQLQRLANDIRIKTGRAPLPQWELSLKTPVKTAI